MRKILIVAFLFVVSAFCVDSFISRYGRRDFGQVLEERLNVARLAEYKDPDFGFVARYPSFFVAEPDSADDYMGHCRFNFWKLSMECYVTRCGSGQDSGRYMDSLASAMRAESCVTDRDTCIISAPLYENGVRVEGFRYHAKYVKGDNVWFVYSLHYPEDYGKSVKRLVSIIDSWKVWDGDTVFLSSFKRR